MKVGDTIHGYRLSEKIDRGGSDRLFLRCMKDDTAYIMICDKDIDHHVRLHQHLASRKIAVPDIYWYDIEKSIIVQEDLGNSSLYALSASGFQLQDIYKQAIDELIRLQIDGRPGVPVACRYDEEHMRWEQEYFQNFFLIQYCGMTKSALMSIEEDLKSIASLIRALAKPVSDYLMHRDFQSQNIYYKEDRIRLIDFQSARIGPLTYDLGSLLRDAYVEIDTQTERVLFDYYYSGLRAKEINIPLEELWQIYRLTALQRSMQALGAFANLSLNKNKKQFRKYIPRGVRLLMQGARETQFKSLYAILFSLKT